MLLLVEQDLESVEKKRQKGKERGKGGDQRQNQEQEPQS